MKIENSMKPVVAPTAAPNKPRAAKESTGGAAEVRLSALAGQLQASDAQPPVDAARVAEIRQAIAAGRFSIDTGAIADSLISTARELLSGQRPA